MAGAIRVCWRHAVVRKELPQLLPCPTPFHMISCSSPHTIVYCHRGSLILSHLLRAGLHNAIDLPRPAGHELAQATQLKSTSSSISTLPLNFFQSHVDVNWSLAQNPKGSTIHCHFDYRFDFSPMGQRSVWLSMMLMTATMGKELENSLSPLAFNITMAR